MITDFQLDFKGIPEKKGSSESGNIAAFLALPRAIKITKSLNQMGSLAIAYPSTIQSTVFKDSDQDGQVDYPVECRLRATVHQSPQSSGEQIQIFRGLLHNFSYERSRQKTISLLYADPVVTATEMDEPDQWNTKTDMRTIVSKIFENAWGKQAKASQIGIEFLNGNSPVESATNMGQTDLEFLQKLCHEYGYFFFYDHQNSQAEKIKFFRPDFSVEPKVRLDFDEIVDHFQFSSSLNSFLNQVVIRMDRGAAVTLPVDEIKSSASATFQQKVGARNENGVELVNHYYRPNATEDVARVIAKARLMEAALGGDQITFAGLRLLNVGDLIEIYDPKSKYEDEKLLFGKYLITQSESTMTNNHWSHTYTAVRP